MSRAAIDPAAVEARVRQRIAERGLPPEQVEAVFLKIRPKLEASGLLPPLTPLPTVPGTDNWLARRFGLSPVQITPAKLAELNAAASTMMPRGPGLDADPLAAKYAASGGAYTESGGVIPQYRRGPSGDIVPPPRQIQPMDYGPEILAASRSVTPAEISAMRELAVVEGGSLDGQPDELVAVIHGCDGGGAWSARLRAGRWVGRDRAAGRGDHVNDRCRVRPRTHVRHRAELRGRGNADAAAGATV
ncbi:MAG: hypothetical protein EBR82_15460 [Caulobacteraceae bacterium]|nr:hypothetical protein [Caulobacteraceae bacterium]